MGQTPSAPEDKMAKRIRQTMGSFLDFGHHLSQANDWARLCPTPKTCHLAFRIVVNERISAEILPYVWRVRGNVTVEVRKIRRRPETPLDADMTVPISESLPAEAIGHAKLLTVRQFYYIFCFLTDIKSCAAHTVRFPEQQSGDGDPDFDETECEICMDKQKQVVLPCTHSFCLYCFQHWSVQSKTCPICRSKIECSEGSELWHLTSHDVEDMGSYATDLVARIYEFLEKKERSTLTETEMTQSLAIYTAAVAGKRPPFRKFMHAELFPTAFPLGLASLLPPGGSSSVHLPTELDDDVVLALELASGDDQHAAVKHYEQLRRDHVLAMAIAMQVEDEEDNPEEL